jgi:hypothetical protein
MRGRENDKTFAVTVKIISVLVVVIVFAAIFIWPWLYIGAGLIGGLLLLGLYLLNMHRQLHLIRKDLQRGWLACPKCGYDLRGLTKAAGEAALWNDMRELRKLLNEPSERIACPECGFTSTAAAARKYWFHNTQPTRR